MSTISRPALPTGDLTKDVVRQAVVYVLTLKPDEVFPVVSSSPSTVNQPDHAPEVSIAVHATRQTPAAVVVDEDNDTEALIADIPALIKSIDDAISQDEKSALAIQQLQALLDKSSALVCVW